MGKRTTDGVIGVTSGKTPIGALDSPRAFQWIALLGVVGVVLSGWIVMKNIITATALPKTNTSNTSVAVAAELEKLKSKDTDGDAISDYDELYSLHTSPYLKDSDGDGTPDGTEYQNGTDPNCPQGKVCEGFRLLTSITDSNGNVTPEFLRKSLASAGVPQAALDQTDDASLLKIYQQVIQSQSGTNTNSGTTSNLNTNGKVSNSNSSNTNSASSGLSLAQLQNLSSNEIRQLLIDNGIDATTLNSVDDATLRQIFLESINTSN